MNIRIKKRSIFLLLSLALLLACDKNTNNPNDNVNNDDPYVLVGEKNFLSGYDPVTADGLINAVIEIPAGTNDKWEVNKETGNMEWEFKNGSPRVVKYLAYPVNYGMIPRTLLPEEAGGDGDPLDILVLGPAVERGSVVKCKLIGVLLLTDSGEQDDKLVALMENTAFDELETIEELDETFPGVTVILSQWFTNYKGPGKMETHGFGDKNDAGEILNAAIEAYKAN
ncbi:MAG: inorganic diphosphatase [Prolixibacteraceae bacterium]|nr:inorganic diphosphatase [Prolixibacteraceae bacterium]